MMLLDSNDIKKRVAAALRGEQEQVAIEATYHLLGGSENWIVRQGDDFWWLENRQNGRRVEFREGPVVGVEIELPAEPSDGARRLISRALAQ